MQVNGDVEVLIRNNQKLDALIYELKECQTVPDFQSLFESDLIKSVDFSELLLFSDEKYTRTLIYENDMFELILICWGKGQKSLIHDHAKSQCVMVCVSGLLLENLYSHTSTGHYLKSEKRLKPFYAVNINNNIGLHEIININDSWSASLHLYSPKIASCNVYESINDKPKKVLSSFSAFYNQEAI